MLENKPSRITLAEASASFMQQTRRRAAPALREARLTNDPNRPERQVRRRKVLEQVRSLHTFLDDIDGSPPVSLNEALQRQETLIDLLVHPIIDEVMIDATARLSLPENSAICVIGSGGKGAALVRTLTATDTGFDAYSLYNGRPDLDTVLFSRYPFPYTQRDALQQDLDAMLESQSFKSCTEFNISNYVYSTTQIAANIQSRGPNYSLDDIDLLFYAGYPKSNARELRKEIVDMFVNLGETNPEFHAATVRKMKALREFKTVYTSEHFNYRGNNPDIDQFRTVRDYFSNRITGVYNELWDMTYPQVSQNGLHR
jgi:hypothetical protein